MPTPNQQLWLALDNLAEMRRLLEEPSAEKKANAEYKVQADDKWSSRGWLGWPMISYCVYKTSVRRTALLLHYGANPNDIVPSSNFRLLTHVLNKAAALREEDDYTKAAIVLIENIGNPKHQIDLSVKMNVDGFTCSFLAYAVYWNYPTVIKALLEKPNNEGGDVNSFLNYTNSYREWQLLAYAVYKGYTKTALLLLAKGADPKLTIPNDNQSRSLLAYALDKGYTEIAAALGTCGAKLKDEELRTHPNWQMMQTVSITPVIPIAPSNAGNDFKSNAVNATSAGATNAFSVGSAGALNTGNAFNATGANAPLPGSVKDDKEDPPSVAHSKNYAERSKLEIDNATLTKEKADLLKQLEERDVALTKEKQDAMLLRQQNISLSQKAQKADMFLPKVKKMMESLNALELDSKKKDMEMAKLRKEKDMEIAWLRKELGDLRTELDPSPNPVNHSIALTSMKKK